MNIQRDTEYRYGELVQSPEFTSQRKLPKYFVYRRITATESTSQSLTPTKELANTWLNGIREDICGRYFEADTEFHDPNYVPVGSRYIFNKGTEEERIVYSWDTSTVYSIPATAKIEVDIPSLNNIEATLPFDPNVYIYRKGEWYNVLDNFDNNGAVMAADDPQIDEITAAKALPTLKEHTVNIHIYGRDVNNATGLAIEPGTDIYVYTLNDDAMVSPTELMRWTVFKDGEHYFIEGEISLNNAVWDIKPNYGYTISEFDLTDSGNMWDEASMSLSAYLLMAVGVLPLFYTMHFIWHVPYGYDVHDGSALRIFRNNFAAALTQKGADISGIGEIKIFVDENEGSTHEGKDPVGGPIVLVDSTGKKFGIAYIHMNEEDEDLNQATILYTVCDWSDTDFLNGKLLITEDLGSATSTDLPAELPNNLTDEQIINNIKSYYYPYDELYLIRQSSDFPKGLNDDCRGYMIGLEKYTMIGR